MTRQHTNHIAILAWGSLLWEPNDLYDPLHTEWQIGGPLVSIEFSRISHKSRLGALTLVIDPENGTRVQTFFGFTTRDELEDAICDLRTREGTLLKHIGFVDTLTNVSRSKWCFVTDTIRLWTQERGFRATIWTDLHSNFFQERKVPFSVATAIEYLKSLPPPAQAIARLYVNKAKPEVKTALRDPLSREQWFRDETR